MYCINCCECKWEGWITDIEKKLRKWVVYINIYIYIYTHTSCSIFFIKPFNFFVEEFYLLVIVPFSCTLFLLPKSSNAN